MTVLGLFVDATFMSPFGLQGPMERRAVGPSTLNEGLKMDPLSRGWITLRFFTSFQNLTLAFP